MIVYLALLALQVLRAPALLRGVLSLKILALYIPIYFLVTNNPPTRRQLRRVLWLLVFVAAGTAVYGVIQFISLRNAVDITVTIDNQTDYVSLRNGAFRVFSTFSHSTIFSLYLSLMLTLCATLVVAERGARRILAGGIGLLLVGVLPLTLSRIGWIGAGIGLSTFALLQTGGRRVRYMLLTGIVLAAFLGFATPAARDTLDWSFTRKDASFTGHAQLVFWAHRMTFIEKPWGCGLGALGDSADLYGRVTCQPQPRFTCFWRGYAVTDGETMALIVGTQAGAPGYLLYLAIHFILWREGLQGVPQAAPRSFPRHRRRAAGLPGHHDLQQLREQRFASVPGGRSLFLDRRRANHEPGADPRPRTSHAAARDGAGGCVVKLLLAADHYLPHPGGSTRMIFETSRRLAARGHQVTILTFERDALPEEEQIGGVRVRRVPLRGKLSTYPRAWATGRRAALRETATRYDLVHVHLPLIGPAAARVSASFRRAARGLVLWPVGRRNPRGTRCAPPAGLARAALPGLRARAKLWVGGVATPRVMRGGAHHRAEPLLVRTGACIGFAGGDAPGRADPLAARISSASSPQATGARYARGSACRPRASCC